MRFESSGAATSVAVMATLFSLTTAIQILRVEKRRLTIVLMYGIITAEKRIYAESDFRFRDSVLIPPKRA